MYLSQNVTTGCDFRLKSRLLGKCLTTRASRMALLPGRSRRRDGEQKAIPETDSERGHFLTASPIVFSYRSANPLFRLSVSPIGLQP
jgi:hypothetical protein